MTGAVCATLSFAPLRVVLDQTEVAGIGSGPSVSTSAVTATATGGVPPYSHAWSRISGSSRMSAVSPTSASTAFRVSPIFGPDNVEAGFIDIVTDAAGHAVASPTVAATVTAT